MALLDSLFKDALPSLSGVVDKGAQVVNYVVAPVTTVINETWNKVSSTFGGVGPFSKLNESAPSFETLKAGADLNQFAPQDTYYTTAASVANTESSSVSAGDVRAATGGDANLDNTDHMVKLTAEAHYSSATSAEPYSVQQVVFYVMPEVTESRSVDYEALSPSQLPGEFHKYKGTKSTMWTINATMVCSTRSQARRNYVFLNTLRGWTMPYFGEKQITPFPGKLGAPPPVLQFAGWRGLVGDVPVVITSLNWSWPKDVDWLPTGVLDASNQEVPFPTVMTLSISLVESFSPEQFNGFDLEAFRNGNMIAAFARQDREVQPPSAAEADQNYSNEGRNSVPADSTAEADENYSNEGRNSAVSGKDYSNEGRNSAVPSASIPVQPRSTANLKVLIAGDKIDLTNNQNSLAFQRDIYNKSFSTPGYTQASGSKALANIAETKALIARLESQIASNTSLLSSTQATSQGT